ncbi:uncharacterized protein MELLADRAFT_59221 [Melampsora larici-populina 98AG31]|uniref:Uncharacterized protein n=1 Tax=Melampsora larici-populina (strain 98AG31 / pathotype 3-4-7) TaxID=747676 RepID=F4R5H9_MELLP|nr:uncharacterized protein MELLADRAFT_59221 [Melampsora larici-populina 98AG31]EGG12051.1 hypothetical protein MELLADRAFT_59221 [Melampsora larici-populina 98AG31]
MASPQSSTQSTKDLQQSQLADNAFNTANPMSSRVSHGTKDRSMSTPVKGLKNSGSATPKLFDQEKTALPVDSRHQLHHNGKGQVTTGLQSQPAPKHEPMYKKLNHLLHILENTFSSIHPASGTQRGPTWVFILVLAFFQGCVGIIISILSPVFLPKKFESRSSMIAPTVPTILVTSPNKLSLALDAQKHSVPLLIAVESHSLPVIDLLQQEAIHIKTENLPHLFDQKSSKKSFRSKLENKRILNKEKIQAHKHAICALVRPILLESQDVSIPRSSSSDSSSDNRHTPLLKRMTKGNSQKSRKEVLGHLEFSIQRVRPKPCPNQSVEPFLIRERAQASDISETSTSGSDTSSPKISPDGVSASKALAWPMIEVPVVKPDSMHPFPIPVIQIQDEDEMLPSCSSPISSRSSSEASNHGIVPNTSFDHTRQRCQSDSVLRLKSSPKTSSSQQLPPPSVTGRPPITRQRCSPSIPSKLGHSSLLRDLVKPPNRSVSTSSTGYKIRGNRSSSSCSYDSASTNPSSDDFSLSSRELDSSEEEFTAIPTSYAMEPDEIDIKTPIPPHVPSNQFYRMRGNAMRVLSAKVNSLSRSSSSAKFPTL